MKIHPNNEQIGKNDTMMLLLPVLLIFLTPRTLVVPCSGTIKTREKIARAHSDQETNCQGTIVPVLKELNTWLP